MHKVKGFTLPEIIAVLAIAGILSAIAISRYSGNDLKTTASQAVGVETVNTLFRLEELACAEHITLSNTNELDRILEIQSALLSKGHLLPIWNPTNIAAIVLFQNGNWSLK